VTGGALAAPLRRGTGFVAALSALAGAIVVLAAIGAVHLFGGAGGAPSHARSTPDRPFSITAPRGWTALRTDAHARVPAAPVAFLRRDDGRGTVIVRRIPALSGDLRSVARDLTAQLRVQIPGFRLVGARIGRVRAGAAFLYTFARGNGAAQSLTVTKVHGATYRIDTVVPAGAPDAAREAGAVVSSFGP
jgi:hypothetical protein